MTHRQGNPFLPSVGFIILFEKGEKEYIMGKAKTLEEWNDIFQNFNPNISVIKELDSKNKRRCLLCYCSDCGQTFERIADKYKQHCPICNNKKIVVGFNDMATTAPWMLKYLKNIEDGFKYTKSCGHRIIFKCPDCGNEKECKINNVYNFGFKCSICSDGLSRPNKFARSLFLQLPVENLEFEYNRKWTNGKKYDVYFEYNDLKYVVEMDGEQHFKDSQWGSALEQQNNDKYKTQLANDNNVHIIRIPCYYLDYKGMINSFYSCEISDLIRENNVDWDKCIRNADKNYLIAVCDYFNNNTNVSIEDIGMVFDLSRTTIRKYLKIGTKLNYCNYDEKHPYRNHRPKKSTKDVLNEDLFYKVCEYGTNNKDATYKEFLEVFDTTRYKISQYLTIGRELGYTEHSYSLMKKRISKIANGKQKDKLPMVVEVYNYGELIGRYVSYKKCIDALNKLYPNRHYERHKLGSLLKENKEVIYKELKFVSLK